MRTVAEYYTNEGGGVNIPAIIASLAGLATFFTFLAKSIHRVKPGEQAIRMRGGRVVRYRNTRPIDTTEMRMFLWFGPIVIDPHGNTVWRSKRQLWWVKRINPPRNASPEEILDPYYGQIKVLGPRVYFALWLFGEIAALNTQDNSNSTVKVLVEVPKEELISEEEDTQRELEVGLIWGVTHSVVLAGITPNIARAVVYGSNGLQRLVELSCMDALREVYESPNFTYEQRGDAQFVHEIMNGKVQQILATYGTDLRRVTINSRAKSIGQMVKESGGSRDKGKILGLLDLIERRVA